MRSFILGALITLLCSCTHTSYLSSGQIPLYIGSMEKHHHELTAQGTNTFFFWGIEPAEHKVYIDKLLAREGFVSAANIRIQEYQKWDDFLVSFFSLGMFIKKSYSIRGYGMQVDK